ncbi:type II toxin-antitoxin system HipA family toxin [Variovorax sp. VNK109]|uniref:type II toxin-antitoxin system HipA family toxin n=1 Tax=Variovorax sp. VNK109 TaxID=3400919 RepID=UPI003C01F078
MNVEVLVIRVHEVRVGILFRYAPEGAAPVMRFVADETWAAARPGTAPVLSQSFVAAQPEQQRALLLNVLDARFNGVAGRKGDWQLPSFFQNLLPEGVFRDHVAQEAGCAPDDHFRMLAACGLDLPGAVTARWEDVDRATLARLVTQEQDALEMSVGAAPFQGAVSLSGVQPKLAVLRDANGRYVGRTKIHRTTGAPGTQDAPDTHVIAKLPAVGYPRMPEVEDLSLRMARAVGVNTCAHSLVPLSQLMEPHRYDLGDEAQQHFLAVERFDRAPGGGLQARVMCEDFAQVLSVPPEDKYSRSYAEIAAVLLALPACGEPAVHELLRRLVVNELIGNADAHLKNIGLIYRDGRTAELSPAYDVVALCLYGVKAGHALRLMPAHIAPSHAGGEPPSLLSPVMARDFCRTLGIAPGPASAIVRQTVLTAAKTWASLIRASALTPQQKSTLLERVGRHVLTRQVLGRNPQLADEWRSGGEVTQPEAARAT